MLKKSNLLIKSKPRARDSVATKASLLNAAQTVFAQQGFSGARIDDVAALSGYNKSLIFQYFKDKNGLYLAVIQRLRQKSDEDSVQTLAKLIDPTKPLTTVMFQKLFKASVAWSFSHLETEPEYLRLFIWEMAQGWHAFAHSDQQDESSKWGLELLRAGQKLGLVRKEIAAQTIMAQLTLMPLATLATIPRFANLYENYAHGDPQALRKQLQDQVTKSILRLALPD
jgi:TetR/AcrR family transcriptional regulator